LASCEWVPYFYYLADGLLLVGEIGLGVTVGLVRNHASKGSVFKKE